MASPEFRHLRRSFLKYSFLCSALILVAESRNLSVEEVRCQVNQAHNYLHTAIDLLKTAQSKLPEDINIIAQSSSLVESSPSLVESSPNSFVASYLTAQQCQSKPIDCDEIYQQGERKDGVYKIWLRNRILDGPLDVYCDMESDQRGWTVIQRRGDFGSPEDYFHKDWNSYKNGFGELDQDFWIGNDKLFVLTNQKQYTLRINLTDWKNVSKYADYGNFWVDNEQYYYTLHVESYNGTAGDSLSYHDGSKFSTKDRDNDSYEESCALAYKGGWWFKQCMNSNLNGFYYREDHAISTDRGVGWRTSHLSYSHKDALMKISSIRES